VCLDIARDDLAGDGIHWDGPGDKNKAVCLDGLAVDAGQGLGGLVGDNGGFLSHDGEQRDLEDYRRTGERAEELYSLTTRHKCLGSLRSRKNINRLFLSFS
jgi:hypothetical protein